MYDKKTINDIDVKGKRVFVRVDFNTPMKDGVIVDETRIRAAIPTIQQLVDGGAKVILASHLGRPKGEVKEELRLTAAGKRLSELMNRPVKKLDVVIGEEVERAVSEMQDGDIILLENVRFHPGEEKNDPELSKSFAKLADIYVNDAFGTAHRAHSSTAGVAEYIPAVSGLLIKKELDVLGKKIEEPTRPFTAIIGGSKVKDKIGVIDKLLEKVDYLILGGGLSYTFSKAQGYDIGKSLLEEDKIDLAKEFIAKAKAQGVELLTPIDAVVANEFSENADSKVVDIDSIPSDWMGLDIGPKTAQKYADVIKSSKLIIWNGPMGVFEIDKFAQGTKAVANAMAETQGYSIIGGGDSASAVKKMSVAEKMNFISTGGGASLELMEGIELPGIAALEDK